MIVLDYLKPFVDRSIVVPPFHTGHLGFVPGIEVNLNLMAPYEDPPSHCEILVSPIRRGEERNSIMRLSCVMYDQLGVVGRLVDAISELKINILSSESSSINYSSHHYVNMIIDWKTADKSGNAVAPIPGYQRLFKDFQGLIPLDQARCARLVENILARCGDVIVWEDQPGALPSLSIRPLEDSKFFAIGHSIAKVRQRKGGSYRVSIDFAAHLVNAIRERLQAGKDDPIKYILLSDTEERMLRVFFPKVETLSKIVHLGFLHNNNPGVLSAILGMVAKSDFNILTSLLRSHSMSRSGWEAILEYRGKGEIPMPAHTPSSKKEAAALKTWAAQILTTGGAADNRKLTKDEVARLLKAHIEIVLPKYPKKRFFDSPAIPLNEFLPCGISGDRLLPTHELLKKCLERLESTDRSRHAAHRLLTELSRIHGRAAPRKPSVFLSYPHTVREHATMLTKELDKLFEVEEFQDPNADDILKTVLKKISECDFFIGIWHEESLSTSISPWMPFEYGVASALAKPIIVVHSRNLDPRIWKRISPGISHPEYSDLEFQNKTIPAIIQHCKRVFLGMHT